jgi:ribosomal protein L3 glutamine methyltransferase
MTTTLFTTPRDLLRYAVSRFNNAKLFFGHGSAEAFDEAAYLILHTLKLPLDKLEPFLDARLLPEEVLQVLAVIERRTSERVPAAYITNEAWLGTYAFYVDERVLVPRSFIAELIPQQFSPWVEDPYATENILELCTGSGCLAIMMADCFPNAVVDAIDISTDAINVAVQKIRHDHHQSAVCELRFDEQAAAGIHARAANCARRWRRWHGPGAQDRRRCCRAPDAERHPDR